MTTQKEIQLRYEEIDECVKHDEAMMLAILLHMFGGSVRELWDAVHEDISLLRDAEAYSKDKLDFQNMIYPVNKKTGLWALEKTFLSSSVELNKSIIISC